MQADPYWDALLSFLEARYQNSERVLVPSPLREAFDQGVTPDRIGERHPADFAAVVLHKGDLDGYPVDFLYTALVELRPTFANEVFVVLAPADVDGPALVGREHVSVLSEIVPEIAARASAAAMDKACRPSVDFAVSELLMRAARFITLNLVKSPAGTDVTAVSETAIRFCDSEWYWGDDAGKVAELFCLPALLAQDPSIASRMIDFILQLSAGQVMMRRAGPAETRIESADPRAFRASTPFSTVFGDLTQGRIQHAVRFNDGRARALACQLPGHLSFTWRGIAVKQLVADTIFASSIEAEGQAVHLQFESTVRSPLDSSVELATLSWRMTLNPDREAVDVAVLLKPSRWTTLHDVCFCSGFDDLADLSQFTKGVVLSGGRKTIVENGLEIPMEDSASTYLGLSEGGVFTGHAAGIHIAPDGHVAAAQIVQSPGLSPQFSAMRTVYKARKVTRRRPLEMREQRLVTAGGYYDLADEYMRLLRGEGNGTWCMDPSMSYDIGVELNAVATYLFMTPRLPEGQRPDAARLANLRDWYDCHLTLYVDHLQIGEPDQHERVFVRGAAFVLLSLDVMGRLCPEGRYKILRAKLTEVLLGTEVPVVGLAAAGIFSNGPCDDPSRPELDSHAAVLLALARVACATGPDDRLSAAIERGVFALHHGPSRSEAYGNMPTEADTILLSKDTHDIEHVDTGFWNYKLGLMLRAFRVIEHGRALGCIKISDSCLSHMNALSEVAKTSLISSCVFEDGSVEIRTSCWAGETNSETQPWAVLGIFADIDAEILGIEANKNDYITIYQ